MVVVAEAEIAQDANPQEVHLFQFLYDVNHFTEVGLPLHARLDTEAAIDQFRIRRKILDPGSDEYKTTYESWRNEAKHSVLIIGGGKAGETAQKACIAAGIHAVTAEATALNGGRAAFKIDAIKHSDLQRNAFRDGATVYSKPEADILFNFEVPADRVQDFARDIGFAAVLWVGGGPENTLKEVDYTAPAVFEGMTFITHVNEPLMYGTKSLREIAHDVGYIVDPVTGVPLPTLVQGGGRVAEDVIVKDVAMRIMLALERKAQRMFHGPEDADLLAQALTAIDAIDPKKFFIQINDIEVVLQKLHLTHADIGETVLQYQDDQKVMKLSVLKPEEIAAEITRREKFNAEQAHETDKLPLDRRSVEKFLRARPEMTKEVEKELAKWKKEFGIFVEDHQSIASVQYHDGQLFVTPLLVTTGGKFEADFSIPVGAVITAIGFRGIEQITDGDIEVFYAGMANTGEGALPATIKDVNRVVKAMKAHLDSLQQPTIEQFKAVQQAIAKIRESQGETMTDPVERVFHLGPQKLLEEWMVLDVDNHLDLGSDEFAARDALDVERQTRAKALITTLLEKKYSSEFTDRYPVGVTLLENGFYSLSLGETQLQIAVGSDWSLYEIQNETGGMKRINSLDEMLVLLDGSILNSESWGGVPIIYADAVESFYMFGAKRLAEARAKFGPDFLYYPTIDSENNSYLAHTIRVVTTLLPWLQTGIQRPGDASLVPMEYRADGTVDAIEIYIEGLPSGLRITVHGLERTFAPAFPWIRVQTAEEITGPIYGYTRGKVDASKVTLGTDVEAQLASLHHQIDAQIHMLSGRPYELHSPEDVRSLVEFELFYAVQDATNVSWDLFRIRPLYMRKQLTGYEIFSNDTQKPGKLVKIDLEGTVLWGWGNIPGPTTAIHEAMLRVRRDIAISLLLGDATGFSAGTYDDILRIEAALSAVTVSPKGEITITINGKEHFINNDRNLRKFTKMLRKAFDIRVIS